MPRRHSPPPLPHNLAASYLERLTWARAQWQSLRARAGARTLICIIQFIIRALRCARARSSKRAAKQTASERASARTWRTFYRVVIVIVRPCTRACQTRSCQVLVSTIDEQQRGARAARVNHSQLEWPFSAHTQWAQLECRQYLLCLQRAYVRARVCILFLQMPQTKEGKPHQRQSRARV